MPNRTHTLPASDTLPTWMTTDDKIAVLAALDDYLNGNVTAVSSLVRERWGYRGADAGNAARRYKAMLVSC